MEGSAVPNKPTKQQQVTIAPFDSAHSVVYALQTRDAAALQAALNQIDKRASALNAKPAPRGSPDLLLDYLSQNPKAEGIFAAWDLANKTNNSPLAAAVLSCLTSVVRLLSTDPFTPSPELIKTLLSAQYTPHLERALNPGRNDVTTAALKLCNVLVGFAGGRFARRVFGAFGWSPKITTRLYKTRLRTLTSSNALLKPDLRTLLVLLVLGFLSANDVRLKAQVLETKGLLSGVFKGLNEDPESVVNLVLETVGREVVLDRRVGLEARRNVFDEGTINELVKLYDFPLPSLEDDEVLALSHPSLSIHRFLRLVSHWLADQIASSPIGRSFGPQKVLGNILKALKVTEEREQRELGLEILAEAPLLVGAFWAKFPSSLDPRLSSRWISAITFATQVVSLSVTSSLSPALDSSSTTPAPPSLASILDSILPPPTSSALTRAWYTKALTHDSPLVSFLSSLFLLAILQKAAKVLEALAETSARLEEGEGGRWAAQARRVREELRARLPDPTVVVGIMSRTVAAASGEVAKDASADKAGKGKDKKEKKSEVAAVAAAIVPEGAEGALLRTNVALRMLFLYHRVAPSLISSLKFDFSRLPQTFASRPALPAPSSSSGAVAEDAPSSAERADGLVALSAAYALRLAAAHSASSGSATAAWSRPADHYKQVLSPLFELYRVPAVPSNRRLVGEILARQLSSPVLFRGASEGEIGCWLRALPVPRAGEGGEDEETKAALDFFQEAVRKTLTTPVKAADLASSAAEENGDATLSPLLRTVLASLPALPSPPPTALISFLRTLFLAFLASSSSLALPKRLLTELKDALSVKGDEGRRAVKGMKECLAVVEGKEKDGEEEPAKGLVEAIEEMGEEPDEAEVRRLVEGLGPRTANVFKALEDKEDLLKRVLPAMPIELVLLHARPSDLSNPTLSASLLSLVSFTSPHLAAVQLLLHRLVNGASTTSAPAFGAFIAQIYAATADEDVKTAIRERVGSKEGLRKVFEKQGEDAEVYQATTTLLAAVFDSARPADATLVRSFCELILQDLSASSGASDNPKKRRKSSSSAAIAGTLSHRVLAAAPLLGFFDASASLPLLSSLLTHLSASASFSALLSAAFTRVLSLPSSPELDSFWTTHFVQLNDLAAHGNTEAGELLVKGAEALLPFAVAASKGKTADSAWRKHAAEWAAALLSGASLVPAQAKTLAALVYRSAAARERFVAHLATAAKEDEKDLLGLAEPLKALLKVAAAQVQAGEIVPEGFAGRFVHQLVTVSAAQDVSAALAVVKLLAASSPAVVKLLAASSPAVVASIKTTLDAHLASLAEGAHRAVVVRVVGTFAEAQAEQGVAKTTLEACVNGCAHGLVRRFAETEEDEEEVKELVRELAAVVAKNQELSLNGHVLDPLLTAIATRRLDQPYAVELATALSKAHQFKENEVSRHLNEIFASSAFISYASAPLAAETATETSAVLSLVLALASSSASAAANSRAAERLIPFYRGTLSATDRALLSLFQRVELASGQSVSPVLRQWNPSTSADAAATLLDGTRVATLGASSKPFVRRSWSRAFASTRQVYSAEDDAKTYDPRFLLAFVGALAVEDEMKPQEWTTLLESGALGTVVASLTASEPSARLMARATLSTLLKKIQPLTFREKDELLLVLTQCRHAVFSPAGEPLPASIALFLAHCTSLIGQPQSPLYPAFQRFLLQRATVDLRDVPMFYLMLFSSKTDEYAAAPEDERRWMVRFLTEGLVRTQDWKIYRRRQVFEILASLFHASRQDTAMRQLILQFLLRATSIPTAARELLSRNGLLGLLVGQMPLNDLERQFLLRIVKNVVDVLSFEERKMVDVADAVSAIEAAVGPDVTSVDPNELLDLVHLVISRLPSAVLVKSNATNLATLCVFRLSKLLVRVSDSLASRTDIDDSTLSRFYWTATSVMFVRFEAGLQEGKKEAEVWSQAVQAGLKAGVPQLREEVVRRTCE
ncbi:hypothetical protein JCM8097_000909 [Rhodosporidiobolus ruineniae]